LDLPLSLRLYRLATRLLEPALPLILGRRLKAGKEDAGRIGERRGLDDSPRPPGPLVWLHGASVGESLSLLPLVERLRARRPDIVVLVTSGTVTSAELLAKRLPPEALHRYVPVDAPGPVKRFLDHWRPDLAIFVESEFWPNLLLGAKARGAKLALVSARMTDKSAAGWARQPDAARALLGAFDLVLPQDAATGDKLKGLGARVDGYANLKLVGGPLPCDEAELARLRAAADDREIILAASTHEGEELLVDTAVRMTGCEPLLVIAPRHPARGPGIAADLRSLGRRVALRSAGETPNGGTEIYVADTLGEMGLFFTLADVVVLGGSFTGGVGGHNPLEPARLGKPVLYGSDYGNWTQVFRDLGAGALRCDNEGELIRELSRLLRDRHAREAMGGAAKAMAERQDGAFDALWARLEPLLP
jgi:3-deoxy-D-manno-octulosonic-acid transferase